MKMVMRLAKLGPTIFSSGLSVATLFKLLAAIAYEPTLDETSSEGPSIFVYAMY